MSRSLEQLNVKEKAELVQEMLDKKNGVLDKDWCDMVRDYGLECSPETLRKAGVGVKLAQDAGMEFASGGDGTLDAGDYMTRQKILDTQRSFRKDMREASRSELLRETIRDAVGKLKPIEMPRIEQTCWLKPHQVHRDLVVGIGDFHYGAKFTVYGLQGEVLNEYDTIIFERRMAELALEICTVAEKEGADQITIMMVGDALDGLLRASQISRLEYGVVDSAIYLSEFLAQWLKDLFKTILIPIRVYSVRGNHGEIRPLGSKAGQFPEENMERIVMHYLYARFEDSVDITIYDDDAPMVRTADVCGYTFCLLHGQGDSIEKIARDYQTLYNDRIDVFLCGHLHKNQTFTAGMGQNGNILIERVPSICGMDPYAQSKGYGSPPGATLILMEEGYGRRCVYPIKLK